MGTRTQKTLSIVASILAWAALVLQFYLIIKNRDSSVTETIIRYFSFFTILTNLLVAICTTSYWMNPGGRRGNFFSRPSTITAIAVYITIVGLVYNVILRFLWSPKGLQLLVDELLHVVVPLMYLIFWIASTGKRRISWRNIFSWLLYPLTYFIVILARGAISGYYPYPFINVVTIGYARAMTNSAFLLLGFVILALFFIRIVNLRARRFQDAI